MKVKQLIEELSKLNQEAVVVLSRDPEGNSFSLMDSGLSKYCVWRPETSRFGEIHPIDDDYEEDEDDTPAVVLWPV